MVVRAALTAWEISAFSPPRAFNGGRFPVRVAMKKDIHPEYHPVVFQDMTTGKRYTSRSTTKSDRVEKIEGVDHYVVSMGVTADSHPFFTGQKQFVDTEGRIDKFQKRFGAVRRAKKPGRGGSDEGAEK